MTDKDDSGAVSVEEAMRVLYLRHGKADLDEHLTELFGHADMNSEKVRVCARACERVYTRVCVCVFTDPFACVDAYARARAHTHTRACAR